MTYETSSHIDWLGKIDLMLVIDTTGSMGMFLEAARQHAQSEAERISAAGDLDVRVGIVEYRDHPPQEMSFVTRTHPFMPVHCLRQELATLSADGGGDAAEAVWDGVSEAARSDWRPDADRIIILIGDSPPHGYGGGDAWIDGCPCGRSVDTLAAELAANHVRFFAHSIAGMTQTRLAFDQLAELVGGEVSEAANHTVAVGTFTSTLTSASASVTASREYLAAASSLGSSADADSVAQFLGWSSEKTARTMNYVAYRNSTAGSGPTLESNVTNPSSGSGG